jgi:dihydrofolate reductase
MIRTSLIVAMADNRAIGLEGGMPWHISADLRYFKQVTMGAPVIMGRKTYESIGCALPGRANIVVTRNTDFAAIDADVVHDVAAGLRKARAIAEIEGGDEVFVIGGAEIYAQAMGEADRVYLTRIHAEFPGDAFFPDFDEGGWQEVAREIHPPENEDGPSFSFTILDRLG